MGSENMKLRIGFFIDGGEEYGVLEYLKAMLTYLDRAQVTVIGIFFGNGKATAALQPLCDETVILGKDTLLPLSDPYRGRWNIAVLVKKLAFAFIRMLQLARIIKTKTIDVIDINFFPHNLLGGFSCRLAGCPCIWHSHGISSGSGLFARLTDFGAKHFANTVVCVSGFVQENLSAAMRAKALVIYNGIDAHKVFALQEHGDLRKLIGVSDQHRLIGIFGSISLVKGHELFLKVAANLSKAFPDARFVIVGHENETLRMRFGLTDRLHQIIAENDLADKVFFTGFVPEAWRFMGDCDIICMPTVSYGRVSGEGFGLVAAETMAAGVPIVAAGCGALPEIIENMQSGILFEPGNEDEMTTAITKLLNDETFRRQMAENGQKRISENFDISRTAQNMQLLYRSLLRH